MIRLRLLRKLDTREKIKIFGPTALVLIFGFILAYQFVAPAPPQSLTIGTGSPEGAYSEYAKSYQKLLAEDGVELKLRNTAGSAENLSLLETTTGGVDIAFVQSGLKHLSKTGNLKALGSLFFEPLWIFHQNGIELKRLSDLKGLRIAVGEEGSGTKILAKQLLDLNGVSSENARLLSVGSQKAVDMLLKGMLDVAIFVSTHRASYVLQLLESRSVQLIGLERAEAYALRYHYLYVLKLPEGVLDFVANIPAHDLTLVAPTTQLVARSDLHPALIDLLLQAAKKIHHRGGGFEREGAFPSPKYLDFGLSEDAERFYQHGSPFLQRYLPFWVATFLTRMKIMLVPLIVLLFPFFKIMPLAYRWRMRSKIYRWYSKLEAVDPKINKDNLPEHVDDFISELDLIEEQVSNISVPLPYSEELYALRLYIGMLRDELLKVGEAVDRDLKQPP
jgi:TRAP transporter TAXI family solute receptor